MSKQSAMVLAMEARYKAIYEAKYEAEYEAEFNAKMRMVFQMGQDAAMIAAHEVLGMGPGRAEAYCLAYMDTVNEMAQMMLDDQKDDSEFAYTRAKVDEHIRAIVGEKNFAPWEERYGH